jgi:hypothetical protein
LPSFFLRIRIWIGFGCHLSSSYFITWYIIRLLHLLAHLSYRRTRTRTLDTLGLSISSILEGISFVRFLMTLIFCAVGSCRKCTNAIGTCCFLLIHRSHLCSTCGPTAIVASNVPLLRPRKWRNLDATFISLPTCSPACREDGYFTGPSKEYNRSN